jgi:hypothetical protein
MSTIVKQRKPLHPYSQSRSSQSQCSRRLFLEGLENRSVLAGDVLAIAAGSNLVIHGDAEANGVHIQTMMDGSVEVSGMDAGGSSTTINGSSEPFVVEDVKFLTRVSLGDGDDMLLVDSEASANTNTGSDSSATANVNANASVNGMAHGRFSGLINSLFNGEGRARQQLMINTGAGHDTVDAEVAADVNVRLMGNLRGDDISIETIAEDSDSTSDSDDDAMGLVSAMATVAGNVAASSAVDANATANADLAANIDSALQADLNAMVDAAANTTLGGIGLPTDLDSALVASLAGNAALNSSSNLGSSSLLNTDQNLNGSIGGAAALNLVGDRVFDEVELFNLASLANLNSAASTNLANANASSFGLSANTVDNFFANASSQADLNAGLLANLGNNDLMGSNSLNTNVNANLNSAYQSRFGVVPVG